MQRDLTEITIDLDGRETHPSWITIRANRISHSPPGRRLFDSEINHQHYVTVTIERCDRRRDLNHDWIHNTTLLMEIDMSMAQWGGFVSSFGDGSGVPVTLSYLIGEGLVAEAPYDSRLGVSIAETKGAAKRMVDEVDEAYQAVQEGFDAKLGRRDMADLLRNLKYKIENTPANVSHAAKSLSEHVENTVAKARGDVEAMVTHAVLAAGLEPGSVTIPALMGGDVIDVVGED